MKSAVILNRNICDTICESIINTVKSSLPDFIEVLALFLSGLVKHLPDTDLRLHFFIIWGFLSLADRIPVRNKMSLK